MFVTFLVFIFFSGKSIILSILEGLSKCIKSFFFQKPENIQVSPVNLCRVGLPYFKTQVFFYLAL